MTSSISKLDIASFIIAILAIIISYLSYDESKKVRQITENIENSRSKIVFRISVEDGSYKVSPPSEDIIPQQIVIRTPTELGGDNWDISNSSSKYAFTRVSLNLQKLIEKKYKPQEGHVLLANGIFPVAIDSTFVFGGEVRRDSSLYLFTFRSIIYPDKSPSLEPISSMFDHRATDQFISTEQLDTAWVEVKQMLNL